jgi:ABC-type bacteriocin/lantibiotic exporter with double-glycine peptidase domain
VIPLSSVAKRSPFTRTLELARTEREELLVAVVYSAAIGGLSLTLPVAVQALVNSVAFGSVLQPLLVLTLLVSAALLASAILHILRTAVLETVQRRIFVRHASDVLDKLLRVRTADLDEHQAPELVNRFLDVVTVQKSSSVLLVDGLTVLMQTLIGLGLLAAYHPWLLAFDVVLIVAILLVLFVFGRGAVPASIAESKAKYDVLAWLEDVARHSVACRTEPAGRMCVERADGLVREYLRARKRRFRIWFRQICGAQLLQAFALSGLLGIGGYLVIEGSLTLGQLVAAELVVSLAVSSFAKFGKSLETFYDLQAALDKLGYLTDLPTERAGGEVLPRPASPASLRVQGVRFGYEAATPVLQNIALTASPRARVAVHGKGATGKSTLLDLLYGLREPDGGTIAIDAVDYRHVSLSSLRDHVMLVRGANIFPGTVYDNVSMGTGATPAEVRSALERSGVWSAVAALPEGLSTTLTTSGRPLTPSQALRLTMARAILRRPRLLLIDEALDAIDDLRVGGALVRTLFAPDAPWTLILATERPELLPLCDRIYVIEDGTLRAEAAAPGSANWQQEGWIA